MNGEAVPERVGKYRIDRVIGRGATGIVLKGYDEHIDRPLAIKTLRPEIFNDIDDRESFLKRCANEAHSAARCLHPNIVTVFDFVEHERRPYVVTEYIDAGTLEDVIQARALIPIRQVGEIMAQILLALDHAHSKGVIHRDIKPTNILCPSATSIKVADFGMARLDTLDLTNPNKFGAAGTPNYMAPERFLGRATDVRGDLFSAGVILYQLLTGAKPFTAIDLPELMRKLLHELPRSIMELRAELWPEIDAVALKALARNPEDRFQSAESFVDSLNMAIEARPHDNLLPLDLTKLCRSAKKDVAVNAQQEGPSGSIKAQLSAGAADALVGASPAGRSPSPDVPGAIPPRRRLRAVFAADAANFGGLMTTEETRTVHALSGIRQVAREEFAAHGGWLFGLPGDGIFALFESAVDAVRCALSIQSRMADSPKLFALKLRIGVHLGEVLFQDELPYGEALVIASRLESLAEPGGILVSAPVMDAVASHVSATFIESGVRTLKHSPRRIETFRVLPPPPACELRQAADALERTVAPTRLPPRMSESPQSHCEAPAIARLPTRLPLILSAQAIATEQSPPAEAPPSAAPVSSNAASPHPMEAQANCDAPVEAPSIAAKAARFDDASLNQLALLLTRHLGPVARLLVGRKAAERPEAADLIRMLAQDIPAERERLDFLAKARALLSGRE